MRLPQRTPLSATASIATNSGNTNCAKAGICCAPISSRKTRPNLEPLLCWWRSEEAFKTSKATLAIRPVFHQLEGRIEAHVFTPSWLIACTSHWRGGLHALAPGLTPRALLVKFAAMQMIDVHLPTTDGPRAGAHPAIPKPNGAPPIAAETSNWSCPQPPPRIAAALPARRPAVVPNLRGSIPTNSNIRSPKMLERRS